MAKLKLKRPTKEMMLAVNAAISGNKKGVNQLVREHKLNRKELQQRVEKREGEKYSFSRKPRARRTVKKKARRARRVAKAPRASKPGFDDIASTIDGRTKTVTLMKLEARVAELLKQKPKREVTKVRDTLKNYQKMQRELQEMEARLGL